MPYDSDPRLEGSEPPDEDRRKFLAACGKFATVTPPVLTVLLSTSVNSEAVAKSGGDGNGRHDSSRWDHHHHDRDRDMLEWLERLLGKFFLVGLCHQVKVGSLSLYLANTERITLRYAFVARPMKGAPLTGQFQLARPQSAWPVNS
jgi:hypothetical protein